MKKLIGLSLLSIVTLMSCNTTPKQSTTNEVASQTTDTTCCKVESKLTAYYFHNTRRCATCKAVEDIASQALKEDNITLMSVNIEEAEGKALAEKLNISGQTLLIVSAEKQENLTNFAFLNASSNPELLKAKIKETVKDLTK